MRELIRQFPHCDPRILHRPGQCEVCDLHPDWQELREAWQIAFTGQKVEVPTNDADKAAYRGPLLPCPADHIRGDTHVRWHGNRPIPVANPEPEGTCSRCKKEIPDFVPPGPDGCTMGYYFVGGPDSPWRNFRNPGETVLCDPCMWNSERYIAVFGTEMRDSLK